MVQLYKLVLVALTAGVGGVWIGQTLDNNDSKINSSQKIIDPSATVTSRPDALSQLQQQIQQLQTENNQLKKQLQINIAQASTSTSTEQKEIDNTSQSLTTHLQTLEMEKQQRKAADVVNWIKQSQNNNRNFDLNNELSTRFEQESRDPAWAEQQENHYRQLFTNNETLSGIALRNTQCRSSQCEISVGITNTEQSNQLLQTITKALASNDHPVSIMVATDERSGTSKLYISNNEDTFAFN